MVGGSFAHGPHSGVAPCLRTGFGWVSRCHHAELHLAAGLVSLVVAARLHDTLAQSLMYNTAATCLKVDHCIRRQSPALAGQTCMQPTVDLSSTGAKAWRSRGCGFLQAFVVALAAITEVHDTASLRPQ
jgi:hypothetical protein